MRAARPALRPLQKENGTTPPPPTTTTEDISNFLLHLSMYYFLCTQSFTIYDSFLGNAHGTGEFLVHL